MLVDSGDLGGLVRFKTKKLSWDIFFGSESHGLVTSSVAASGGRLPLPVPAYGGPGAPPPTAAEVTQTFRHVTQKRHPERQRGRLTNNRCRSMIQSVSRSPLTVYQNAMRHALPVLSLSKDALCEFNVEKGRVQAGSLRT